MALLVDLSQCMLCFFYAYGCIYVFISVTAEMWVPIKEVPEPSLEGFLDVKMKEGFTLVGLEQTAQSVSLEKYNFPKKTVSLQITSLNQHILKNMLILKCFLNCKLTMF